MTANAKNLSSLANALDDGTSGQFLQSTGSGGVVFADVAAGATVYDSAELLPLAGNSAGDMAYVTGTNRFYINNGSGWYSISLVNTNPNITSVQDASANTTPFTLATDGSATVITVTANDPEQIPLTFGYSVTAGSLTNGGGTTATVTQADNVFTVTPTTTEAYVGDFTLTFTASDGVNTATSANLFSLAFRILNSKYTALLATATGTSGNKDITDASSSNHTITVTGDAHAGTFSPYRHGGYSTYFDGSGDYIDVGSAIVPTAYDTDYTIEMWIYPTTTGSREDIFNQYAASATGRMAININTDATISFFQNGLSPAETKSSAISANNWYHLAVVNSSGTRSFYVNGSLIGTATGTASMYSGNTEIGRLGDVASNYFTGYITDVRVVNGTALYTGSFTPPTGRLTAVANTSLLTCHLPYITDGSSSPQSITVNGNTSTKPFAPYDNAEYEVADHGGSIILDGSDNLKISSSSDFAYGTGDFTVEFWFYYTGAVPTNNNAFFWLQSGTNPQISLMLRTTTLIPYAYAPTQGDVLVANTAITPNTWQHHAMVRQGNTLTLYLDGNSIGSTTYTSDISSSAQMNIGSTNNNIQWVIGSLTDFRVVKGTAVYTGNFTPPTGPLTTTGGTYPSTTNVNTSITAGHTKLFLKGTDASIIDKSQVSNLKLVGNTTGSTTQVKFANTKSMYFDGTGDSVFVPYESIPSFGIIEFTIEGWIYMNNLTGNQLIVDKWVSGNSQGFQFYHRSTGSSLTFYVGSTIVVQDPSSSSISAQTWHHVAVTRDSSANVRLYVDGLKKAQSTSNVSFDSTIDLYLGVQGSALNNYFNGYMQDVRLSNKALYTADDESSNIPSAPLKG